MTVLFVWIMRLLVWCKIDRLNLNRGMKKHEEDFAMMNRFVRISAWTVVVGFNAALVAILVAPLVVN